MLNMQLPVRISVGSVCVLYSTVQRLRARPKAACLRTLHIARCGSCATLRQVTMAVVVSDQCLVIVSSRLLLGD
jgi:hypothetical protein